MDKKLVMLTTTAHYKLDTNGLSQKKIEEVKDYLDPNKKYGQTLSCFYNYCLFGYVGTGKISVSTYKDIQKHTLIKTSKGYKSWNYCRTIIPAPKDVKKNYKLILPKSFTYKGCFRSASAIFNLKLQTLIQEQKTQEFYIGDKELEHLTSHYINRGAGVKRDYFLRYNLQKGYFHQVEGKDNKYRLSKENEHLYKYLIDEASAKKPASSISHSTKADASSLYALRQEIAMKHKSRERAEIEKTPPLSVGSSTSLLHKSCVNPHPKKTGFFRAIRKRWMKSTYALVKEIIQEEKNKTASL